MKYFAQIDGKQVGPLTLEDLPASGLRPTTYVWCKGMNDWRQAREVADICRYYRNYITDLQHPKPSTPDNSTTAQLPTADIDNNTPIKFRRFISADDIGAKVDAIEDINNPPKTWLTLAIIASIFCFFPTGLIAIFMHYQSKRLWLSGDKEGSHEAARKSKIWTGLTLCIGAILLALLIRFM